MQMDEADANFKTGNISTDEFLAIFTSTSSTTIASEAGGGPGGGTDTAAAAETEGIRDKLEKSLTKSTINATFNPPLITVDGEYTVTSLIDPFLSTQQTPLLDNGSPSSSLSAADINDTFLLLTNNFYNSTTNVATQSILNLTSSFNIYNNQTFLNGSAAATATSATFNSNLTSLLSAANETTQIQWDGRYPSGYTLTHIIIASVIVTILMIIIIVGNMLVIIAIATEKSLKNIQNWFIASLAVADFFLGLIIMPFSLANELMGYWIFGSWWCDIHSAMDVLLCTSSIMNLCLISLDRYWSITKAVDYLKQRTPARAALMIAAVWIMSALICIPPLLGWKVKMPEGPLPKCAVSKSYIPPPSVISRNLN